MCWTGDTFRLRRIMTPRDVAVWLLAAFFIAGGVYHFVKPGFYLAMMPPWLPAHVQLVQLSGAFEILGGIGVLVPATRSFSGWGLIALLIAVFPANLHMALNPAPWLANGVPLWRLYVRLPVQALFIAWAWWATRRN